MFSCNGFLTMYLVDSTELYGSAMIFGE